MNFSALYRASFYTMLVCATLVLSSAGDEGYAVLFPIGRRGGGGRGVRHGGPRPRAGPSQQLLDSAGIGAWLIAIAEYAADTNALLTVLGHLLVYLQLILMFRAKSAREDWRLFLLGLVQVMVGTVLSQSETIGVFLFVWAVLALWVLALFSLRREADRRLGLMGEPASPGASRGEPYPGLLNPAFFLSAMRVTLTTLLLGGLIFLLMPRRASMGRALTGSPPGHHLTGFDDEVKLGQMGEILENDEVVMRIELFDEEGNRYHPVGEPLWRGVTMAHYEDGRWKRQVEANPPTFPTSLPLWAKNPAPGRPFGFIRQHIRLEPNDSRVLFALRPMRSAFDGRSEVERQGARFAQNEIELHRSDGTITRPDPRSGLDYQVWSFRDDEMAQIGESYPDPGRIRRTLGVVPDAIRDRIAAIAEREINQRLNVDQRHRRAHCARALETYLRDNPDFGYTLKLDRVDATMDPVLDFLVNRKEGHCEYFASGLTMLLRSVGIPARSSTASRAATGTS